METGELGVRAKLAAAAGRASLLGAFKEEALRAPPEAKAASMISSRIAMERDL